MDEKSFAERLCQLRVQKAVSARDMSLSIGQNPGYINSIETGKALPSMSNFFYICNYLDITPMDFFDYDAVQPRDLNHINSELKNLSESQFNSIKVIIEELARLNRG
ncbi:MAG: helix-turn-helix transcriptional regulator [Lachnospiraceae bacterium]|nr:helix-turn-helix transcriptional regulator [Lachnospiraceae bacterium]